MIRVTLLVDSPNRRAQGNAVSRLALGLVETGRIEVTLLCYSADPPPPWLPAAVHVHRLGVGRVARSLPGLVRYPRAPQPGVLITPHVHSKFLGLAASVIG